MENFSIVVAITPNASRTIAANDGDDLSVVSSVVGVVITGEVISETTQDDQVVSSYTPATVRNDGQIIAATTRNSPVAFESVDPAKATVSQSGYVQSIGTGSVAIRVKTKLVDKQVVHAAGTQGGQTAMQFLRYSNGTLGKSINDAADSLATASQSKQVLSAADNATSSYTRNANCWVTANKTCWPVWGSTAANKFNGCLISPRHMLFAAHAKPANSSTLRFLTNGNQVITRTVGSSINVGTFDLSIGVLTEDVPGSIAFAKVLPANWQDHLTVGSVPIIAGDQELKMLARDWHIYAKTGTDHVAVHRNPTSETRLPLAETIIGGDSGSPLFVLIGGELVAIGCHYTAIGCPMISGYYDAVNAAMTTLGGNYQLTPVDLSAYPSFGP